MPSLDRQELNFLEELEQSQQEINQLNEQRNASIASFASMVESVSTLSLSRQVAQSLVSDEIPSIDGDDIAVESVRTDRPSSSRSWINKCNDVKNRPSRSR